jgi:hypothetical protein
VCRGLGS